MAITITKAEARETIRILGALQTHLESAIHGCLVPGTNQPNPHCEVDVQNVAADRRLWKRCEKLVASLDRKVRSAHS